jgi:hypothetical protein
MAMTAPTVPTAPLPSEWQEAIERTDDMAPHNGYDPDEQGHIALFRNLYESDWQLIRKALLTMQRERDEANQTADYAGKLLDVQLQNREQLDAEIASLTEQLAASERTCAELRESLESYVRDDSIYPAFTEGAERLNRAEGLIANSDIGIPVSEQHQSLEHWKARAEAAERTVEEWWIVPTRSPIAADSERQARNYAKGALCDTIVRVIEVERIKVGGTDALEE